MVIKLIELFIEIIGTVHERTLTV